MAVVWQSYLAVVEGRTLTLADAFVGTVAKALVRLPPLAGQPAGAPAATGPMGPASGVLG